MHAAIAALVATLHFAAPTPGVVVIVPLGAELPTDVQAEITRRLVETYGVTVELAPKEALPKAAWYPKRGRWRAEVLLDHLREKGEGRPSNVTYLGLTSEDISTSKPPHEDWGIFGLGELPGRACVVSWFRLKGATKSRAHFVKRVAVTAVHEVGHTRGLPHCEDPDACVMQDAQGSIANTDATDGTLGPACRARLAAAAGP